MRKHLVLRTQANEVREILQGAGLNPSEFEWGETTIQAIRESSIHEASVSVLTHQPTGSEFTFDLASGLFSASYAPGPERPYVRTSCQRWESVRANVDHWARTIKREIDAPDLWAAVAQEKALAGSAASEENTAFTEDESARLDTAVAEIREYLRSSVQMQQEQGERVDRQFEYLRGAIHRMARQDWLHTAIGVLFTVALTIGAEQARDLFRFAWQQISTAIGLAISAANQFFLPG